MKKRIGSMMLTLALVLSLIPATAIPAHAAGAATVSTWTELQSSISGGATPITLAADLVVPAATDTTTNAALKLTYNVTIDGGGHTISVEHPYVEEDGRLCASPTKGGVFYIDNNANATIKNATIMGGQVTDTSSNPQAAIQVNKGYLTLEYVTLTRSNRGLYAASDGRTVLKQCNVVRNVALAAGGGGIAINTASDLVLDGCSVSENRSYTDGGAFCFVGNGSGGKLYANNTVFANNWAGSQGGVLRAGSSGTHYLMNCTLAGNVSADNGGAIYVSYGYNVKAANCIILDNRVIKTNRNGTTNEANDIYLGSSSSGNKIGLFYCLYGTVAKDSNDQSFENVGSKTGSEKQFATSYRTDGILSLIKEGSGSTTTYKTGVTEDFPHPAMTKVGVRGQSGVSVNYILVYFNRAAYSGGTKTYFDYSITGDSNNFGKMSYGTAGTTNMTWNGSTTEVKQYINGSERSGDVIGACGWSNASIYTVKLSPDLLSSGFNGGTVTGTTFYGESYEYNRGMSAEAIPDDGMAFVNWDIYNGAESSRSTKNPYSINSSYVSLTLTPHFAAVCAVTFDPNGGSVSPTSNTALVGSPVGTLPTPIRAGYTFDGWYTAASGGDQITAETVVEGDVTYYAHWTPIPATAPTITNVSGVSLTYGYSSGSVSVTASPATGHTITGYQWYESTSGSNSGGTAIPGATSATYNIPSGLNLGTYYCYCVVSTTRTDNGQTASATSNVATISVVKVDITPTVSITGWTYGDTANTPSVEGNTGNGGVTYAYTGTARDGTAYSSSAAPIKAGSYTVTATIAATTKYNGGTATANFTIEQRPISEVTWGTTSFIYNGGVQAPTALARGIDDGDTFTVTVTGGQTNAGTYTATASGLSDPNYKLPSTAPTTSFTITKRPVTVSGITAENKVYDSTTTATLKYDGVTLTGKIDGDDLSVTATGTFDSALKGTDKTVTISGLTLGGTDAGNYVLAAEGQQTTTTANITGAATSVTTIPTASAITYGQTLADSTLTGGVGSVAGTFSWTAPTTAPAVSDSGATEYDVTFTPTDAENYAPSTCKVKLTVSKATPNITVDPTASEIGYGQTLADSTLTGGAAKNPNNSADVAGTFAWTDKTTAPAKADSNSTAYSVTFTPTDTTNYTTTTTAVTLTVNKAARGAVTVTMANYTYGNSPSTPSVSGNPESTTVTYYYSKVSFLSSDPDKTAPTTGTVWTGITGTTLDAGTYFMRAVLAESDNYTQYVTDQVTFTVTKAAPAAPTAPTVSGYTVTINEADRAKRLEYAVVTNGSAAPTTYKPVPMLSDGAFTLSGLAKETSYTIYLRERASTDGNYTASAAASTNWTTPTEWMVVYNANRGTGTVPATQNGTGATAVTISSDSGLSRAGYTFSKWNTKADGTGTTYSAGDSINTGGTLYAQWTPNTYTVKFNANGGDGTMADESFTYDTAQAITANAFTRGGYTFAGWSTSAGGPVLYGESQSVKNLAVSGGMTLYAVWTQNTYAVTGSIMSSTDGTVTLNLMQGNTQFATVDVTISGGSGTYQFNGVPAGTYNLVAIQGDQTVTALIVITNAGVTQNITMPSHKVNSVLKVEGGDTPPVVVGGLDSEAESKAEDRKTVTITMTIEKQEEQQLPETATEAEQETQEAIEAIESAASGSDGLEYMNITVQKEVKDGSTTESTETLTTTSTVMEIVIPYDMNGKTNIKVYRHHDGAAAALTQADTKTDGTYQIDTTNGLIYVYANQFSTYAIAYEEARSNPVTPPSSSDEPTDPAPKPCAQDETCPISAFTDADPKAWYHDGVHYVLENGIMSGYGNGLFGPSDNTSRATMVQILWNMEGKPIVDYTLSYTDVNADKWYIEAIRWATAEDIMNGYGGGLFGPDDAMTREQLAAIVHRYAKYKGVDVSATSDLLGYSDADKVGAWALAAMKWAVSTGIITGKGNGILDPKGSATRAEIAQIVKNYEMNIN